MQATRLATSSELLTRLVALTALEKFLRKATCVLIFSLQKFPKAAGRQNVNNMLLTVNATSGAVWCWWLCSLVDEKLQFYLQQSCSENIKQARCCHQKSHIWLASHRFLAPALDNEQNKSCTHVWFGAPMQNNTDLWYVVATLGHCSCNCCWFT